MVQSTIAVVLLILGYIVTESSLKLSPYNYMNFIFFIVGVGCLSGGGYLVVTHT